MNEYRSCCCLVLFPCFFLFLFLNEIFFPFDFASYEDK